MGNDTNGQEHVYYCPPKLTTQYRIFIWNVYDIFIGLFVVALGLIWFGVPVFVIGIFYLILKAYFTDEKSVFMLLKAIFIYIVRRNSYSQYIH